MTPITTTENRTYEVADIIVDAINKWNLKVDYACNNTASVQRPIIDELQIGGENVTLRGTKGYYFIEYYAKPGTMYPSVYRVKYTPKPELTNEEMEILFQEMYK